MNRAAIKTFLECAFFSLVLWTGCDQFPVNNVPPGNEGQPDSQPQPTNVINVDGNWRHAAAGTMRETCFTIQGGRVTRVDDGCTGNILHLASTPSNQGTGSFIAIFVGFSASATDTVNGGLYTYQLQSMPDGTLQGPGILRFEPSGPILSGNVIWIRE